MKRALFLVLLAISICASQPVWAEGNVGLTYSQILEERMLGLTGGYTTPLGSRVTFESHGQFHTGDVHNLKVNTDFIFDIATIDLKLLIENKIKGHTLDSLGREQGLGLALTVPVEQLNFDIGIGGKNASPFASPNAFDVLVGEGFKESDLTGKGLSAITPKLKGLPFKEGSALNAFISTGFKQSGIDVDVKGIVELLGEGDKQHQVHFNLKKAGTIGEIALTTGLEFGFMTYADAIYYETALITSAGFDF